MELKIGLSIAKTKHFATIFMVNNSLKKGQIMILLDIWLKNVGEKPKSSTAPT